MAEGEDPDVDGTEMTLEQLLEMHPDSGLGALGSNGFFVPMPASIAVGDHPVLQARTGTDLVVPADRVPLAKVWIDAPTTGGGRLDVRLLDGRHATCHLLDERARHGVWVLVVVSDPAGPGPHPSDAVAKVAPRVCTMRLEESSTVIDINEAATGMLGWRCDEMAGLPASGFIHDDDQARAIDSWLAAVSAPGVAHRFRCRYLRRDRSWLWTEITLELVRPPDATEGVVSSEMVDVSEEMAAHEALQNRERLLHQLTEALPSGVLQVDRRGQIVHKNRRVDQIVGHPEATTLAGQLASARPEDRARLAMALGRVVDEGSDHDVEVRLDGDGQQRAQVCQVLVRRLTDELGVPTGAVVSISDVTESTELRSQLRIQATYDSLTSLRNRASVMALLDEALLRSRATGGGVVAIFIDVDRFKLVNDTYGHPCGDHLLVVVAERLRDLVDERGFIGRIGGDEFLIGCPTVTSLDAARLMAERVADGLRGTVRLRDGSVELCASVGAVWSGGLPADADGLVARADAAMYESKRHGAGQAVVFGYEPDRSPVAPSQPAAAAGRAPTGG